MADTGNAALWFELLVGSWLNQPKYQQSEIVLHNMHSLEHTVLGGKIKGIQPAASDLPALSPLRGAEMKQKGKQSDLNCKGQQDACRLKVTLFSFN